MQLQSILLNIQSTGSKEQANHQDHQVSRKSSKTIHLAISPIISSRQVQMLPRTGKSAQRSDHLVIV